MKKIIFLLALLSINYSAHADFHYFSKAEVNPMFGKQENQIVLNIGAGVDSGIIVPPPGRFVPFSILHFQYSQPSTFFRLPARGSINIAQTIGFGEKYNWNWDDYSTPMIFLSEDVALLHGQNWYAGCGAGIGFQAQENERIGSKLIFQFKLFTGYKFTDNIAGEFFVLHMSDGNTSPNNNSYAFYGFGLAYSF